MQPLKIAIIGAGFIGQQHVEAIRRIPGTEVAVLVESDPKVAEAKSRQLGIPRFCTSHAEMLQDNSIDIVHNCTPNSLHFEINRAIIASGKHVFSEKPLAISSQESGLLADLAAQHRVANAVNYNYRHNAMAQAMKQRLQSGESGRILTVHGHYLQDWLLYDTDFNWRMDPAIGGPSRAVADIGSHWFDLVQFVTGQKIQAVHAHFLTVHPVRRRGVAWPGTFSNVVSEVYEKVDITTEDAAFIMLRLADGTPGILLVSQVCAGKKNDLKLTVSASDCSMEWDQENPDKLHIGHRNQPNETLYAGPDTLKGDISRYATLPGGHPVGWADAFRNGIAEFYHAIRQGSYLAAEQTYATFRSGHAIMRLIDACMASNQQNCWVELADQ